MRRQDVALPPDRGWQWTGDWQVPQTSFGIMHAYPQKCHNKPDMTKHSTAGLQTLFTESGRCLKPLLAVRSAVALQVASDAGSCDGGGWQYRAPSGGSSSETRPSNPTGQQGWDAQDSATCSWRRRHWARHRRRRQNQVLRPA